MNYPDDIRSYDWHPQSPFYEELREEEEEEELDELSELENAETDNY